MRYSQMNTAQRAYINGAARFTQATIRNGKVVTPGRPMNAAAEVLRASRLLDQDDLRRRNAEGKAAMDEALACFTSADLSLLAAKFEAGRAYGSGDLTRQRAGAMPMRYFRGTQYGC